MKFEFDIDKTLNAALYVVTKIPSCDKHKLFKVLYFAEKDHLSKYGRPITGDYYVAMKYGPVPHFLCDAIKSAYESNPFFNMDVETEQYFEVIDGIYVGAKRQANTDHLSESDIVCIDKAIAQYKDASFNTLTTQSHDSAWDKAFHNAYDSEIKAIDIAHAAGANLEMLKYIQESMEHQHSFTTR
ncbi:MAG: Panacea domain-containing protein [Bacteroidota bacterium]